MKNPADSPSVFDKSAALAARFRWRAETGSTNDDLAALARSVEDPAPNFTVVATDNQTAGRGRLGRSWVATSGKSLAISVLVRPTELFAEPDDLVWIPLLSGIAMARAVQAELEALLPAAPDEEAPGIPEVTLKWPNDVLIGGFKVSGILTELLPEQQAVVIGAGVNLTLDEHDLPTLTSTSIALAARHAPDPDRLLASYLSALRLRYDAFVAHSGDSVTSGLLDEATELCGTLGQRVRIDLPSETVLTGTADSIDSLGHLIVHDDDGVRHAIAAGDITHLRLDS